MRDFRSLAIEECVEKKEKRSQKIDENDSGINENNGTNTNQKLKAILIENIFKSQKFYFD